MDRKQMRPSLHTLRRHPIALVALLGVCYLLLALLVDQRLDGHQAFFGHVNKCIYTTYAKTSGGYIKSGRKFHNVSHVFQERKSESGLNGFLNYELPSDKATQHAYNEYYDEVLQPYLKLQRVNVLEIGVKMGGSLVLWRELFPEDAMIYGVDVDPSAPQFEKDAHIKVLAGVSSMDETTFRALNGIGFHVIIDDGDHHALSQVTTFSQLWPLLIPEGVYIIEDIENDCILMKQLHFAALFHNKEDFEPNPIDANRSLAEVVRAVERLPPRFSQAKSMWVTSHEDRTSERLFIIYPHRSLAKRFVPASKRCAIGAFGPRCEKVMVPCGPGLNNLRSP